MKRVVKVGLALLLIISVISLGITSCAKEKVSQEGKLPELLTLATYGSGSAGYVEAAALSPVFIELADIRVRADPTGLRISQIKMIRVKECDAAYIHLGSGWRAMFGTEEYCTQEWGPQRLMMAYQGAPQYCGLITRATSDIKTVADVKGRKCAVYAGSHLFWNGVLAYAGLSLDDVELVPASGYTAAARLLIENKAEVAFGTGISTVFQEMAASPGGIRFIPMPLEDKAAWARVMKINPSLGPGITPEGLGVKEDFGVPFTVYCTAFYVYPDQSDLVTYTMAKVLYEGYPKYKDATAQLALTTPEQALDVLNVPCPYHPGSIKLFKEKGVWTAEHEAWQKKQLELQDNLTEAWGEALKEAESKGLTVDSQNKEWLSLWDSYWQKYWIP